jgi:hypothetical protein
MTDTAANEIAPHLPLLFENEANGILQDPIGAGIVLYVCHMGLALTGTGFTPLLARLSSLVQAGTSCTCPCYNNIQFC